MAVGDGHKYEEKRVRILANGIPDTLTGFRFINKTVFIDEDDTGLQLLATRMQSVNVVNLSNILVFNSFGCQIVDQPNPGIITRIHNYCWHSSGPYQFVIHINQR